MKKMLLLAAGFCCTSACPPLYAQVAATTGNAAATKVNPHITDFYKGFVAYEESINCKDNAVSPATFKASLASIYSRVILSNDGLIKNGTAASFNYDKDLSIAVGYQQKFSNSLYYKVGFNTAIKDGFQTIYQNKQFKNDFTLSAGITVIGKYARRFFNADDCKKLQVKRRQHATYLLNKYNNLLNLSADTSGMNTEIERLEKLISIPEKGKTAAVEELLYANDTTGWVSNKKKYDSLVSLRKQIIDIHKVVDYGVYAADRMSEFEIKEPSILNGYRIHWIDIDVNVPFKGYFLYKTAVTDSLQYDLMGRLYIGVTDNWVSYTRKSVLYLYWGGQALFDRGITALSTSDTITRKYEDKNTKFQDVSGSGWYTDLAVGIAPNANFLWLFGKDKTFGIEGGASFKHYFYSKFAAAANDLWDIRLGMVANLKGEKELSKGTVGLYAMLRNYNGSMGPAKDNVTIGIRVGIPVNRVLTTKE